LFFKNIILKINKGISKKNKTEKPQKMTEAEFLKNMKTDEEEAENLELNKYINKELKNGINQKDDITHEPSRRRIRNRTEKNNQPQGRK
jgi:hypothetical protein